MPQREIVRGFVVLAMALMAVEGWLDLVSELGRGEFREGADGLESVIFLSMATWGVLHDPRKWGFRAGIFGLVALALAVLVVGGLEWGARSHPEHPLAKEFSHDSVWWWCDVAMRIVALAALAVAALSLRWLYPKRVATTPANG